jgi:hypothetical protein
MIRVRSWPLLVAVLLVVVGLPLAGKWLRRQRGPRCSLDGLPIEPLYQARVIDQEGHSHCFCCVLCARTWLERQRERSVAIFVTDETGRQEIDGRSAHFVRSTVVTNPVTENHVHVFKDRADALEHARAFAGWELTGKERPFQQRGRR